MVTMKKRNGFTLLESIVAIGLVLMVFMAFYPLMSMVYQMIGNSREVLIEVTENQFVVERETQKLTYLTIPGMLHPVQWAQDKTITINVKGDSGSTPVPLTGFVLYGNDFQSPVEALRDNVLLFSFLTENTL